MWRQLAWIVPLAVLLVGTGFFVAHVRAMSRAERLVETLRSMRTLGMALHQYSVDHGGYPNHRTEELESLLSSRPTNGNVLHWLDGWGERMIYLSDAAVGELGETYALISLGEDKAAELDYSALPDNLRDIKSTCYLDCDILYTEGQFNWAPVNTGGYCIEGKHYPLDYFSGR